MFKVLDMLIHIRGLCYIIEMDLNANHVSENKTNYFRNIGPEQLEVN